MSNFLVIEMQLRLTVMLLWELRKDGKEFIWIALVKSPTHWQTNSADGWIRTQTNLFSVQLFKSQFSVISTLNFESIKNVFHSSMNEIERSQFIIHWNKLKLFCSTQPTAFIIPPFVLLTGAASAPEACSVEDLECPSYSDQIGLEAIRSLHRQLDDDDNGDIDLSESDDVCDFHLIPYKLLFRTFQLSVPSRRVKVRRRIREATSRLPLQRRHAHFRQGAVGSMAQVGST